MQLGIHSGQGGNTGVFQRPLTLVSDPLDPRFDALKADPEQGLADAKQFLEKALKG